MKLIFYLLIGKVIPFLVLKSITLFLQRKLLLNSNFETIPVKHCFPLFVTLRILFKYTHGSWSLATNILGFAYFEQHEVKYLVTMVLDGG